MPKKSWVRSGNLTENEEIHSGASRPKDLSVLYEADAEKSE
jgi:hypothetical protein